MFTPDDYRAENRTFKSAVLGIRGNPENTNFLKEIKKKFGFDSIGVALDYMLLGFGRLEAENKELKKQLSTSSADIIKLNEALHDAENRILAQGFEKQSLLKELNELKVSKTLLNIGRPEGFLEFTAETVAAFKVLFGDDSYPGHTDTDQIALMMDYCKRDPSNEFPFQPVAETIYNKHKIVTDGGEQNTGAAATEQQPTGS